MSIILVSAATFSHEARADDASDARSSYAQGKLAYDGGDFATASHAFADADAKVSNPRVLELALAAAVRSNDPVFGMSLVERAEARGMNAAVKVARETFTTRVGAVLVQCPEPVRCSATIDGLPVSPGVTWWGVGGEHSVVLDADGNVETHPIQVTPGKTTEVYPSPVVKNITPEPAVTMTPEPDTSYPPVASTKRLSPTWFWIGASATAVVGAAAIASGVDTLARHDDLQTDRTDQSAASNGQAAETRTNLLIGGTIVVAVATAVAGYFAFVRPASARPAANAASASWTADVRRH